MAGMAAMAERVRYKSGIGTPCCSSDTDEIYTSISTISLLFALIFAAIMNSD